LRRTAAQAAVLTLLAATSAWAQPTGPAPATGTSASAATRAYDIAPGPLSPALSRFAGQSGITLSADPALTEGLQTPGLRGSSGVIDGFAQLLQGTGLAAAQAGEKAFVLRRLNAAQAHSAAASAATLAEVKVTAAAERSATSEGTRSYAARAATVTGLTQSLKDIPQSITVVARQRLDDQNLDRYDDVVMQTPGVSRTFVNSGQSGYAIRGFALGADTLMDGMKTGATFGGILGLAPDMATVDRVEVLRGSAGLQLGAGDPAGVVNIVRKRPLPEKQVAVTARAGSWGYKRGELDATGPLNEAGTLRGRAVVAYEDRDYFYERATSKTPVLYGVLEADIAPRTLLSAGARHQDYDQTGLYLFGGLPLSRSGVDLHLPRSFAVGPSWSSYKSGTDEVFADLKHDFNTDWTGRVSVNKQKAKITETYIVRGSYLETSTTPLSAQQKVTSFERSSFEANLQGRFGWLGRQHEVRVGATASDETRDTDVAIVNYPGQFFRLDDPYQSGLAAPNFTTSSGISFNRFAFKNRGVYGNTVLHLAEPLKLTLGARLSWYESNMYNVSGTLLSSSKQAHELTPFAGLVYALDAQWSAYASYSDIFQPQSTYATAGGKPLDPAIGSNYELGIKGELLGGRITTSAALFQIDQTGRATVDTNYPSGGCPGQSATSLCYVNGGKVQSRGLELEVAGELIRGLQVSAGYTYNHAVYLRDRDAYGRPTAKEGQQFAVIPRHTLRAFGTYQLPGAASDWTVGGGISAQSKTQGTDYSGILRSLPGRGVIDAMVRYRIAKDTTVALNLNNLLDKRYYNDEFGYRYGEPRNAMLTLRTKF